MKQLTQTTGTSEVQKAMYVVPCMEVVNVEAVNMLASSNPQQYPSPWEDFD